MSGPVQGSVYHGYAVGGMRLSEVSGVIPLLLSTSTLSRPLFSHCTQKDGCHKDSSWLCSITISGDTRLRDHPSAWVQFHKDPGDHLDAPKLFPPAG